MKKPSWAELERGLVRILREREEIPFYLKTFFVGITLLKYWANLNIGPNGDPFLNLQNADGSIDAIYTARVGHLGSMLLDMRMNSSFDELCRRLRLKARPSYFEILVMHLFFKAVLGIEAVTETGVRGKDFDFTAHASTNRFNVEVGNMENSTFKFSALRNKLNKKMNQVPADQPALLVLAYPYQWNHNPNFNIQSAESIFAFFKKSQRYNAIILVHDFEVTFAGEDTMALAYAFTTWCNQWARNRADISFLYSDENEHVALLGRGRVAVSEAPSTLETYTNELISRAVGYNTTVTPPNPSLNG